MKKLLSVLAILLASVLLFAGCGSSSSSSSSSDEDTTIVIGASPTPHAEILEQVKDKLADEGYTLTIKEFTDYVQPNVALNDGSLDANYFQHLPYLEDYNTENGTDLVSAGTVHYEPFGLYAGKVSSIDELAEGDVIAIPNDATNEARALQLLAQEGLITVKEDAGLSATVKDIEDNPKGLQFEELEAAQIARSLDDVAMGVINGNYAIDAGLKVSEALATENADSEAAKTYANVIAVRSGDKDSAKIQALMKALQSTDIEKYIDENYDGAVKAIFLDADGNEVTAN